jgi:hypothetical protein
VADTYYFAVDGSYGWLEEGSIVCPTGKWTLADWQEVEEASNSERAFVVRGIANKYYADRSFK